MKRLCAVVLSIVICVLIATGGAANEKIRIACLKGPTGMGLAKLIRDAANGAADYDIQVAPSPDSLAAMFIRGEADIFAVPANMAAILWNRTGGGVRVLSVSVTGALSAVTARDDIRTVADLRGMSIISAGRGASPEHVLRFLLKSNGIDPDGDRAIEWRSEHTEVISHMLSGGRYDVAILPHPFADIASLRDGRIHIAFRLGDEWQKLDTGSQLVMGVYITSKELAASRPDAVAKFIRDSAESASFVRELPDEAAALIVEHGILDDEEIAARAIPNCGITSITGDEMRIALDGYLKVLFDADPRSVGGRLPDGSLY